MREVALYGPEQPSGQPRVVSRRLLKRFWMLESESPDVVRWQEKIFIKKMPTLYIEAKVLELAEQ